MRTEKESVENLWLSVIKLSIIDFYMYDSTHYFMNGVKKTKIPETTKEQECLRVDATKWLFDEGEVLENSRNVIDVTPNDLSNTSFVNLCNALGSDYNEIRVNLLKHDDYLSFINGFSNGTKNTKFINRKV